MHNLSNPGFCLKKQTVEGKITHTHKHSKNAWWFFLVATSPFFTSQLTKHSLIRHKYHTNDPTYGPCPGHVSLHVEHYWVLAKKLTHMQDVSWCALHAQGSSLTWPLSKPSKLQLPTYTHLHADHGRRSEDARTHSVFYQLSKLGSPQAN